MVNAIEYECILPFKSVVSVCVCLVSTLRHISGIALQLLLYAISISFEIFH